MRSSAPRLIAAVGQTLYLRPRRGVRDGKNRRSHWQGGRSLSGSGEQYRGFGTLNVAGKFSALAGVVSALRNHFSGRGAQHRAHILLQTLADVLREHDDSLRHISTRIESPEFIEALIAGVDEAVRSANTERIQEFGRILGRSLALGIDMPEAAAFVRDLAQLTRADVETIRLLHGVQRDLLSSNPVATNPNPYTERFADVMKAVDHAGIARDDFYSRCSRPTGFCLALEVPRDDTRMPLGEHCFRLTGRARVLLELAGVEAEAAAQSQRWADHGAR